LFETGLSIPYILAYGLAAIIPIPLMYLVVKFLIGNAKKN
jgi:hypothetical protein